MKHYEGMTPQDMREIAAFHVMVRNYIKMKTIKQ